MPFTIQRIPAPNFVSRYLSRQSPSLCGKLSGFVRITRSPLLSQTSQIIFGAIRLQPIQRASTFRMPGFPHKTETPPEEFIVHARQESDAVYSGSRLHESTDDLQSSRSIWRVTNTRAGRCPVSTKAPNPSRLGLRKARLSRGDESRSYDPAHRWTFFAQQDKAQPPILRSP